MPKFQAPLDLTTAELRNAVVQNLGAAPGSPKPGQIYYDVTQGALVYRSATTWVSLMPSSGDGIYDANSIVKADADNTPVVLPVNSDSLIGRATGVNSGLISSLTAAQVRTLLGPLEGFAPPTAPISMGSQIVSNVATPVAGTDAANKAYVDGVAQGLDVKTSVRAASTADVTIASPGTAVDGVTFSANDRVLLKDQTAGAENGIWVWNGAAVAMTRATDADSSAEVTTGMFTFVAEGTVNADRGYVLTTNDPITLGTTALTFTQFNGAGSVIGTANRIAVTGNQVDIAATYVGQTSITTLGTVSTGTWQGTPVGILYGGTGATTAAGAKTSLLFMTRYTTTIGDGTATSFTVTHNMGTKDVTVELYEVSTGLTVYADVTRTTTSAVTLTNFVVAPTTNSINVVVIG